MSDVPGLARHLAHALANHAAGTLPWARESWAEPMRQEVDAIEDDLAALRWAAGCVVATYSERITAMSFAPLSPVFGLVALVAFVFGGWVLSGGKMGIILEALPHEFLTIVLGALAASAVISTVGGRGLWKSLTLALQGRRFRSADYRELAAMLVNTLAAPKAASVSFPDAAAARMVTDGSTLIKQHIAPDQIGAILAARVAGILGDQRRAVATLRNFARALLWFGGLAFLLGAIKDFGAFTEAPEVIGGMFGSSTVGLIIGIVAAAGIVHPLASRLDAAITDDGNFYEFIRAAFVCRAAGSDAALAVRVASGVLPEELAFSSNELAALESLGRARA